MNKFSVKAEKVLVLVRDANIEGMDLRIFEFAKAEVPLTRHFSSMHLSFLRAHSRVTMYVNFMEVDDEVRARVELSWSLRTYDVGTAKAAVALHAEVVALAEKIEAM